jgi:hypothetical protein
MSPTCSLSGWNLLMAIVNDFSGIAAELRRIKKEQPQIGNGRGNAQAPERFVPILDPNHAMPAGDLLYRRLTRQRRRTSLVSTSIPSPFISKPTSPGKNAN